MHLNKEEGFAGQVSVVLPERIRRWISQNPLVSSTYVTDIGYYPKARHHFRERMKGAGEDILIYVIDGFGEVKIQNASYKLKANEFIVIPSGTGHSYRADEKYPWTIYWLHYKNKNKSLFEGLYKKIIPVQPSQTSRIKERIQLFEEIIEILSLGFSPANIEYANLCLIHLLASFRYIDQFRKVNYSTEKDVVKKAVIYMKQHIEEKLTLEGIASQFKLSVPHFSRLFRQRTRNSPIDYFIQLKMQYACQMLDYSNLKIYEIANNIGYDDTYYFSRLFKKVMGVSPIQYKKQLGNK
jgi:AraC-like DNA-binding protein